MFNCNINITKLGPIPDASIELKNITVFVGKNNTGKTYLLNALYYFQSQRFKETLFPIIESTLSDYKPKPLKYMYNIQNLLEIIFHEIGNIDVISEIYQDNKEQQLNPASFKFEIPNIKKNELIPVISDFLNGDRVKPFLNLFLKSNNDSKNIFKLLNFEKNKNLQQEKNADIILAFLVKIFGEKQALEIIVKSYLSAFFNLSLDKTELKAFLFPVERAGINKFFFESIAKLNDVNLSLKSLIEFKVKLHHDSLKENFNKSDFYEMAREMEQKIFNGGKIHTEKTKDGNSQIVFYDNNNKRFTIDHFSSSINELSMIILYLKFYAKKGDIVLIDEPELSLHPDSQRLFVKYISKLSKSGLKFIMITHSDYIAKEFNNLICLSQVKLGNIQDISKGEIYTNNMTLTFEEIVMYSIYDDNNKIKVESAKATEYGYDEKLFKKAINHIEDDSNAIFNAMEISYIPEKLSIEEFLNE